MAEGEGIVDDKNQAEENLDASPPMEVQLQSIEQESESEGVVTIGSALATCTRSLEVKNYRSIISTEIEAGEPESTCPDDMDTVLTIPQEVSKAIRIFGSQPELGARTREASEPPGEREMREQHRPPGLSEDSSEKFNSLSPPYSPGYYTTMRELAAQKAAAEKGAASSPANEESLDSSKAAKTLEVKQSGPLGLQANETDALTSLGRNHQMATASLQSAKSGSASGTLVQCKSENGASFNTDTSVASHPSSSLTAARVVLPDKNIALSPSAENSFSVADSVDAEAEGSPGSAEVPSSSKFSYKTSADTGDKSGGDLCNSTSSRKKKHEENDADTAPDESTATSEKVIPTEVLVTETPGTAVEEERVGPLHVCISLGYGLNMFVFWTALVRTLHHLASVVVANDGMAWFCLYGILLLIPVFVALRASLVSILRHVRHILSFAGLLLFSCATMLDIGPHGTLLLMFLALAVMLTSLTLLVGDHCRIHADGVYACVFGTFFTSVFNWIFGSGGNVLLFTSDSSLLALSVIGLAAVFAGVTSVVETQWRRQLASASCADSSGVGSVRADKVLFFPFGIALGCFLFLIIRFALSPLSAAAWIGVDPSGAGSFFLIGFFVGTVMAFSDVIPVFHVYLLGFLGAIVFNYGAGITAAGGGMLFFFSLPSAGLSLLHPESPIGVCRTIKAPAFFVTGAVCTALCWLDFAAVYGPSFPKIGPLLDVNARSVITLAAIGVSLTMPYSASSFIATAKARSARLRPLSLAPFALMVLVLFGEIVPAIVDAFEPADDVGRDLGSFGPVPNVRVATWNVRHGLVERGPFATSRDALNLLRRTDANVIVLQAADTSHLFAGQTHLPSWLSRELKLRNSVSLPGTRYGVQTVTVLSAFKLYNATAIRLPCKTPRCLPRAALRVYVEIRSGVVVPLVGVHLERASFEDGLDQVQVVRGLSNETVEGRCIVAGDFGWSPASFLMNTLWSGGGNIPLRDAYEVIHGTHGGRTYHGKASIETFPATTMDYVLSQGVEVAAAGTILAGRLSSHDVVVATFRV